MVWLREKLDRLRWWGDPRQWLRAILMLEDSPHRIALGAALGVFIGFSPTLGSQMLLVLLLAALTRPLFRFSTTAALIAVYVSNPLTSLPLYWFCFNVGTIWFPSTVTKEEFAALFDSQGIGETGNALLGLIVDIGGPLLFGCTLVGAICGLLTYPVIRGLLRPWRATSKPDSNAELPVRSDKLQRAALRT